MLRLRANTHTVTHAHTSATFGEWEFECVLCDNHNVNMFGYSNGLSLDGVRIQTNVRKHEKNESQLKQKKKKKQRKKTTTNEYAVKGQKTMIRRIKIVIRQDMCLNTVADTQTHTHTHGAYIHSNKL